MSHMATVTITNKKAYIKTLLKQGFKFEKGRFVLRPSYKKQNWFINLWNQIRGLA